MWHLLCSVALAGVHDREPEAPPALRQAPLLLAPAMEPDRVYARFVESLGEGQEHPEQYLFAGEVHAHILALVQDKPDVVRPEIIGTSVEGRPLWAFHVVDPGHEVRERVLVIANIHALEWISTEVAVRVLDDIVRDPPDGVAVTVVPVANPDGRNRVETDLMAGQNTYRRANGGGVDLNRDFGHHREAISVWRHVVPAYHTTSPAPLSQPESQALDALAARERFDASVSLHSFGGFIYTPWGGRWERPPDWKELRALGEVMHDAQRAHAYRVRQLSRWGFLFRIHGSELDHFYAEYGTRSFLIELSRSGMRGFRPKTWKNYFRWYNPEDPERHTELGAQAVLGLVRHIEHEELDCEEVEAFEATRVPEP